MSNESQSKPKNFLGIVLALLLIVLVVYNLILGVTIKEIGIPGFTIKFGEKTPPLPTLTTPPPVPPTDTPTPTPNQAATATVEAIQTQLAQVEATQTAVAIIASCPAVPEGEFRNIWDRYMEQLGCPKQIDPIGGLFAEQSFQNGYMFWSQIADDQHIVTIGGDIGTWHLFRSEDREEFNCPEEGKSCTPPSTPPPGRYQPEKGFGCIWCNLEEVQKLIGWATEKEERYIFGEDPRHDLLQEFEGGFILRSQNWDYVLFEDDRTYIRTKRP